MTMLSLILVKMLVLGMFLMALTLVIGAGFDFDPTSKPVVWAFRIACTLVAIPLIAGMVMFLFVGLVA